MKITRVDVRKYDNDTNMKALVSMEIDNCFIVKGIRIVEGNNGLFVAMPSRRTSSGEFKDIAHPINAETRELIQKAILNEYEKI